MTLEDVAKRARVSTATVSRVLNGAREVRPATRARVMRAVEELKVVPLDSELLQTARDTGVIFGDEPCFDEKMLTQTSTQRYVTNET